MTTKTEVLSFKVTPEEKEIIKTEAARLDMTVSKLIYKLVKREYFKEVATDD